MYRQNESHEIIAPSFLKGGGEMGELTRSYDWSESSLGSFENWPQSLRTTVSIILHSDFPMFLWWGAEMIQFYNDAYRPSLGENGKHPKALGQNAQECWPEIWDIIYPLMEQVRATGESFFIEDKLVPIFRNGKIEDVYWTFSYSAVIDEAGQIGGVLVVCHETTKKVEAMKQLESSKELVMESSKNLINTILRAPVAMCIFRGPYHIVEIANDRMIEFWGKTNAQVIGKPIFEGLPEAKDQGFEQLLDGVYTTGKTFTANEVPVTLPRNGKVEVVYVNFVYEALREHNGTISGIIAVAVDVTEQVSSRKKIEDSEARFRSLVSSAPVAIALFVGPDFIVEMPNKAFSDILGKDYELAGKPLVEAMPEIVDQPFFQILKDIYETGTKYQTFGTQVNIVKNGKMHEGFYDFSYTPLHDASGNVFAILDIAVDVTEQIVAKRKAEESERENQKLVTMVEATDDFVGLANVDESVAYLNPSALKMLGWDNTKGKFIEDCIYYEDVDLARQLLVNLKANGSIVHEIRLVNAKTTEPFWILWKAFIIKDSISGEVTGLATVSPNITERRKAEQVLKESEERFRTMAESSGILIAVSDETSNATYFNSAWVELTGRPADRLLKFGWADLIHEDDRDGFVNLYLDAFKKQKSWKGEFRMLNAKDEYRWLLANGPARFHSDGSFAGYISSCMDITDLKNAERTLKDNKKMLEKMVRERTVQLERSNNDLQQFAHVASHDLKEPVRKIKTFANRLLEESTDRLSARDSEHIGKVLSAANRMSTMIDGVLSFSMINASDHEVEKIDLNEIFSSIKNDLEVLIMQKSATIEVENLPTIEGANVLIYQLFYNIIYNALKFSVPEIFPVISITSKLKKNNAAITIKDNGIGFDQKLHEEIFNTFTRLNSKDRFEGTGLGLALCKKIVQRHNGSITAQGEINKGAAFTVTLPINQNQHKI
jgi:hypothetical protein